MYWKHGQSKNRSNERRLGRLTTTTRFQHGFSRLGTSRACVIICSDFSIIPTFCHCISTVLSLYRVFYTLYGVQTILTRVHFALFAVFLRTVVEIHNARVSDPSSSQPDAAILVCFRGKWKKTSIKKLISAFKQNFKNGCICLPSHTPYRTVPQLVLYNVYKKMLTPLPQIGICRRS